MILHDVGHHSAYLLHRGFQICLASHCTPASARTSTHNSLDLIPRGTQCVWRAKGSKGSLLEAVGTNNGWKDTPSTRRHGMVIGTRQGNQKAEAAQNAGLRGSVQHLSVMSDRIIQFGSDQKASYWILIPQLCVLVAKHACCVLSEGPAIQTARAFFANQNCTGMEQPSGQTVKSKMLA